MAVMAKRRVYRIRGDAAALEERIAQCKSKLADPADPDAKGWLTRWLKAAERRLAEKERSLEAKQQRSAARRATNT